MTVKLIIAFVAGLIASPFIWRAWVLYRWRNRPLPEFAICAHCRKIVGNRMDHWRVCDNHPARAILNEIRTIAGMPHVAYDELARELARTLHDKNQHIIDLTKVNTTALALLDAADMGHQALFRKIRTLEDGAASYEWALTEISKLLDVPAGDPQAIGEAIATLQEQSKPLFGISHPDADTVRESLEKFTALIVMMQRHNSSEWMDGVASEINKVFEVLGKNYRVEYHMDRFRPVALLGDAA